MSLGAQPSDTSLEKLISVLFHCLRSGQLYDVERHASDLGCGEALPGFEADLFH